MEREIQIYNAIVSFVKDLWGCFGDSTKVTPLALYNRLIDKLRFDDTTGIDKMKEGIKSFILDHEDWLLDNNINLPLDTIIRFGDSNKVYLEIGKFLASNINPVYIRKHLLTIAILFSPDDETKYTKLLDSLTSSNSEINFHDKNESTTPFFKSNGLNEEDFINSVFSKTKKVVESSNTNMNNPMGLVVNLMSSGVFTDLTSELKDGVSSGRFDMGKLFSSLQSNIGKLMEPDDIRTSSSDCCSTSGECNNSPQLITSNRVEEYNPIEKVD